MHSKKQAGISWAEAAILTVSSFMLLGVSVFSLQHNTTALTNTFSSEILWTVFISSFLTTVTIRNGITVTLAIAPSWRQSIIVPLLSAICILMAIGTLLEFGDGDVQLFGGRTLCVWGWEISKNKVIDIAGVFVFPYIVMLLARTKEFRCFFPGIICMTLLDTLFFWQQTALIFLWLSLLQILAVSAAWFFTLKLQRCYALGWSLLYTLLCAFILRLHRGDETLTERLLPYDWRERKQFVSELMQNTRLLGRATATEHTFYLLEDVVRPIWSLLFYDGWLPVIVYLVLLTIFAGYVVRCLYSAGSPEKI